MDHMLLRALRCAAARFPLVGYRSPRSFCAVCSCHQYHWLGTVVTVLPCLYSQWVFLLPFCTCTSVPPTPIDPLIALPCLCPHPGCNAGTVVDLPTPHTHTPCTLRSLPPATPPPHSYPLIPRCTVNHAHMDDSQTPPALHLPPATCSCSPAAVCTRGACALLHCSCALEPTLDDTD